MSNRITQRTKRVLALLCVLLFVASCFVSCLATDERSETSLYNCSEGFDYGTVPAYSGSPYTVINDNMPFFTEEELSQSSFEYYSPLDSLGRCGTVCASIGIDLMPTEPRGQIGSVKPTAWQISKYDFVDGKYLYNRCHLIGYQLSGENANNENLITGTRYMNVQGMLPFENMVADYVKEEKNHVMYRVTPFFVGDNLLAEGVLMEAYSVEDGGEGICFNVFCYNVQPGVIIDYKNGNNQLEDNSVVDIQGDYYVLNQNSRKFHLPSCDSASQISDKNKEISKESREKLIELGYSPCGACNP